MKLVIVESPTKARTITKFLPKDYEVTSCMGHVRDLPQSAKEIPAKFKDKAWSRLGVDVDNGFTPLYLVPSKKKKVVTQLRKLMKQADELYLATDEDREGESISWHLIELLKPKVPVKRMVFHEITKEAINEALENPRDLNDDLVQAQEARRILDRLVGYTLSPLLWKKVAFGLSAGRVQSVALRLICERELERLRFNKAAYLGLEAMLKHEESAGEFAAKLLELEGTRVAGSKDFDSASGQIFAEKKDKVLVLDKGRAKEVQELLRSGAWEVSSVEEKEVSRHPAAPFITSTLQQDANRKFGWSARQTMQVAQKLYERGYITYMRTDSTTLSSQALAAARKEITSRFGKQFLPEKERTYGKKVKGAQEAHEAIRPAGNTMRAPSEIKLSGDTQKLYDLIWKRTIASQMTSARLNQVSARITVDNGAALFGASGTTVVFPGFLKVYEEGLSRDEVVLPQMKEGDKVACAALDITEHETKPPARYSEARLIKVLEQEGVGRPSTYASIMSTITSRGYVNRDGRYLKPTFTAMVVNNLLTNYFPNYVDVSFTAGMEGSLDDIAAGEEDSRKYLDAFYFGDDGLSERVASQDESIDPDEARGMNLPRFDGYHFRVGRYGAYVCRPVREQEKYDESEVCASIPEEFAPADVTTEVIEKMIKQKIEGGDRVGIDPESGKTVFVLTGRYGPYVQLGEAKQAVSRGTEGSRSDSTKTNKNEIPRQARDDKSSTTPSAKATKVKKATDSPPAGGKPKRSSIPKGVVPEDITLEQALHLLSMPKSLGLEPSSGKDVKVGIGRFGPYIVHDGDYRSLKKDDSVFTVDLARALELLAEPKKGRGRAAKTLKELGNHPKDKKPIVLKDGKYGPYVSWGKLNASLSDSDDAKKVTLERAIALLKEKQENQ